MGRVLDVCFSPLLVPTYAPAGKCVIVADIFRATSTMVTALAHGATEVRPVATLEECLALQAEGYLCAAERNGRQAEGFPLGNSPVFFSKEAISGKKIALSTTNGTETLLACTAAKQLLIGSFLNITALAKHILASEEDVLLVCSGWKGKPCAEDTLFCGALAALLPSLEQGSDAVFMVENLWKQAQANPLDWLMQSIHVQSLEYTYQAPDIAFSLQWDVYPIVPQFVQGSVRI